MENGEREKGCAVEERVIWLVERFGLVGEFKHPRSLPLQPSWGLKIYMKGRERRNARFGGERRDARIGGERRNARC